jgi:predicted enzyme related to lactoylglutathione lyase
VAAAKAFYGGLFGWEFNEQPAGEGATYLLCEIGGKPVAGMMQAQEGMPHVWSTYITVTDVDAATAKVTKAGGQVLREPFDVVDAGRMSVISDPTGAVVCLWQPKQHIGAYLVNQHGTLTWSELTTPDVDRAAAFYADVVGWKAEPFHGMDYTVFNNAAGEGIAGAMKPPAEGMPPFWGIYFAVDDCDAVVVAAQKAGASVMMPPTDTEGVGRMAALQDPQGAVFSVIKTATPAT